MCHRGSRAGVLGFRSCGIHVYEHVHKATERCTCTYVYIIYIYIWKMCFVLLGDAYVGLRGTPRRRSQLTNA